ncbi:hypothetical protein C1646_763143, partial [Rhizophagus diaphanus]
VSWAKAYTSFQFNAGIQSTQSVESFNSIIKKSHNNTSTLCDVKKAIDKRHEEEIRYCKLTDIKALYTTIGLLHLFSQFFSNIDRIILEFLPPLILSMQRFQISQSFTYKGQLTSYLSEDLCSDTIQDNFIEDVVDEPQTMLKALLDGMDISKIYKDEILIKLDEAFEKSLVITAIEPPTNNIIPHEVNFTLQIVFSTAKMAINVALETKSDNELVQLLKNFILSKKSHNSNLEMRSNDQDNKPHVTKIQGALCKKRIKSAIKISSGKRVMCEITSKINNNVRDTNEILRQ